uniref:Uncharacterized protein n=1 Tax=Knipowitschia caucasica TaxID=637954 RepID=A0AAV2J8S1_KNICA
MQSRTDAAHRPTQTDGSPSQNKADIWRPIIACRVRMGTRDGGLRDEKEQWSDAGGQVGERLTQSSGDGLSVSDRDDVVVGLG